MPHLSRARLAAGGGLVALALAVGAGVTALELTAGPRSAAVAPARADPVAAAPVPAVTARRIPVARPAPAGLPKIDYWGAADGFPQDRATSATAAVRDGLRPRHKLAVYDAPGGRPRAFLPRWISGMPVVVPIVERHDGWVAVLLPTLNRRIGWLPAAGWEPYPLRDQLIVDLSEHRLTWLRDGVRRGRWPVATGAARTPTPQGRTFVLGRTGTKGAAYAGLDALVLGAVPEDRAALAPSLRAGHTALHGWYDPSAFGHAISNGCVRMSPDAMRTLLKAVTPGTVVHVAR
ncbi:L,D-transpeptidase [Actinoplanes sp. NPDC051494]|uniref:L,D-transpeptidase n=1 Tax=Actinoplanes sp. NPDC051494 TaxID=3363907 RepID=UPI0037A27C6A